MTFTLLAVARLDPLAAPACVGCGSPNVVIYRGSYPHRLFWCARCGLDLVRRERGERRGAVHA